MLDCNACILSMFLLTASLLILPLESFVELSSSLTIFLSVLTNLIELAALSLSVITVKIFLYAVTDCGCGGKYRLFIKDSACLIGAVSVASMGLVLTACVFRLRANLLLF